MPQAEFFSSCHVRPVFNEKGDTMRNTYKTLLAAGVLMFSTSQALAQATTTRESDTPPTAQSAEQMKNNSTHASNPTEQNPTYKNQAKEQPGTHQPSAPPSVAPTGAKTDEVPQGQKSPRHVSMGKKHPHHHAHQPE